MKPIRVLITNISLSGRSGTETVARDLAIGLVKRGHLPVVYSPVIEMPGQLGVAKEIRDALVPVTDDLRTISEPPDIIHGHHLHETMTACLRFPRTPAIWVCHSWDGPHDKAPDFPNLVRFLAVDESCLERLLCEQAVPKSKSGLLLNSVDLQRFKERSPLPMRPTSALVLSHYAANSAWFDCVQKACSKLSIRLDAVGAGLGQLSERPEELLLDYDLVFAVDRTAMEATAVGNAVILCGLPGLGPMVTSQICDDLYKQNFGRKWLNQPVSVANIISRIEEYDALESKKASEITRRNADSERYLDRVEAVYEQALAEGKVECSLNSLQECLSHASDYLSSVSAAVRLSIWGSDEFMQAKIQRDWLAETAERRRLRLETLEEQRHAAVVDLEQARLEIALLKSELVEGGKLSEQQQAALKADLEKVKSELSSLKQSKTMVIKDRLVKLFRLKP